SDHQAREDLRGRWVPAECRGRCLRRPLAVAPIRQPVGRELREGRGNDHTLAEGVRHDADVVQRERRRRHPGGAPRGGHTERQATHYPPTQYKQPPSLCDHAQRPPEGHLRLHVVPTLLCHLEDNDARPARRTPLCQCTFGVSYDKPCVQCETKVGSITCPPN